MQIITQKKNKPTTNNSNSVYNYSIKPLIVQNLKEVKHFKNFMELKVIEKNYSNNKESNTNNAKETGKPKKGKKSNTKVKYIKNKHIDLKKNYESYKKCKKRTGLIYLLRNPEKLPLELNLQPIFGRIDLETFNFYLNDMAKTKFYGVNLIDILKISQNPKLIVHNCFNIILNSVDAGKLLKGPLTLCFKKKTIMDLWMKTISEFKECQIDSSNKTKANGVLVDFGKVNKLIKDPKKKPENKLYYDNTNKVVRRKSANAHKEAQVKKLMKKIVSSITTGSIATNQIKRKMKNELKKTRKAAKQMQKKQRLIKKIVKKRIKMENKKKNKLINAEAKNKEIRLLKAVKSRIVQLKKKETKKFKKELKRQIKSEKRLANRKTKKMINYLVNKGKSPRKEAKKAAARVKKGLPPKKIKGVKVITPGKKTKEGKPIAASNLTKRQIKKMKPRNRKILAKRAAKAAKQNAKANKVVIPGIDKNPLVKGSISTYAKKIMKNKKLKNYDTCVDNRLLNFVDKKYVTNTCKKIYGESLESKCEKKTKFCGMCCSHHVGLAFKNHYKKCFNQCSNLLRGVKNEDDKVKKIKSRKNDKKNDEKNDDKKKDKKD